MPIDVNLLKEPINKFILINVDELVGSAVEKLELVNGESWWHLVVEMGGGQFAATQFNNLSPLAQTEGDEFFYRPLGSLVEEEIIPVVLVVEQSAIGTEAAKDLAYESPGRVLVVTQDGKFLGIIYQGEAGGNTEEISLLSIFRGHLAAISWEMEGAEPEDARLQDQARYIQAQVYEPVPDEPQFIAYNEPLVAENDYTVNVRIGPLDLEWLGPPPEETFPDDEMDWSEEFYRLQVVFFEPFHAPEPQVQSLTLPKSGPSSIVEFYFHTLPDRADFEARVVMLFENRILQTALLRSRVLTEDRSVLEEGESGLHLVIEAIVRDNLSKLEKDQIFDAALILNHNSAGESSMQAFAGEKAMVVTLGGIKELIEDIKKDLGKIYRSPELFEGGLQSDATHKLLWPLAYRGHQLYKSLLENQYLADHPFITESRLQIVTTDVATFLPMEYIYDRQAPRIDPPAPLCKNAEEALRMGARQRDPEDDKKDICPCECDLEDESEVICPLGFWGLRKVIERFAFERPPEAETLEGEVSKVFAGINGRRTELAPFRRVMYAASKKVDEDQDHPQQVQSVLDALQEVSGNKTRQVFDWSHWREGVEQDQPSLLVLLPHHKTTSVLDTIIHGLEISDNQTRWSEELRKQDVRVPESDVRPVVLLLGCETMSTDIPYESFVAEFLRLGAAIVLGTTTSVLGYHAAPVARKISEIMQTIITENNQSFGDVMLRLRRQAMLEGYPMVLTLFAYGDAGWKLIPAED